MADEEDRNHPFVFQMSDQQSDIKEGVFFLGASLTIACVTDLASRYDAALESSAPIIIDLAEVTECDTAGIQLLLAMYRQSAALEKKCVFRSPSPAISSLARSIGVDVAAIIGE